MTDALARLRKLAEAATPGPWLDARSPEMAEYYPIRWVAFGVPKDTATDWEGHDIALIAAMRNALPLLLDLVEVANNIRRSGSLNNYNDYDTARAALEKVGTG